MFCALYTVSVAGGIFEPAQNLTRVDKVRWCLVGALVYHTSEKSKQPDGYINWNQSVLNLIYIFLLLATRLIPIKPKILFLIGPSCFDSRIWILSTENSDAPVAKHGVKEGRETKKGRSKQNSTSMWNITT